MHAIQETHEQMLHQARVESFLKMTGALISLDEQQQRIIMDLMSNEGQLRNLSLYLDPLTKTPSCDVDVLVESSEPLVNAGLVYAPQTRQFQALLKDEVNMGFVMEEETLAAINTLAQVMEVIS